MTRLTAALLVAGAALFGGTGVTQAQPLNGNSTVCPELRQAASQH